MRKAKPKYAEAPHLTLEQTNEQAFQQILQSCTDQVLHNVRVVLEGEDPEGPHQLRIGLRRLRCALRAYKSLGDRGTFRHLNREARDLARAIGELRDIDVAINVFVSPYAGRDSFGLGMKALMEALASHRDQIHDKVRDHLASGRVRTFELDLSAFLEGDLLRLSSDGQDAIAAEEPVGGHASLVLQTSWRKVSELGNRLDQLTVAERHQMRKALKNFRYVAEFYAPLYNRKAVRRYLGHVKQLQTVFGYLNDVAMMKNLREVLNGRKFADAELNWTIGHIQGANEARAEIAWETAQSLWHKLNRAERFWRAVIPSLARADGTDRRPRVVVPRGAG